MAEEGGAEQLTAPQGEEREGLILQMPAHGREDGRRF